MFVTNLVTNQKWLLIDSASIYS